MDYDATLEQVVALLQWEQCLSYRVLKRRLQLDPEEWREVMRAYQDTCATTAFAFAPA